MYQNCSIILFIYGAICLILILLILVIYISKFSAINMSYFRIRRDNFKKTRIQIKYLETI